MKGKIYSILNIKESESKQVFDLLSVQFFVGLANAFMNIVAFTLFIYTFSINELPAAYLGIAILLFILNIFYEKSEHALSPLQLYKLIILFSICVLVVLWCGLSFWHYSVFFFLLLTCSTLIYMITGYAFWGLVSLLFNVRESKRVFSVVGASDIPAKLFGYLFAPLLIPFFGLINLLWLSIAAFVVAFFLFTKIIRSKSWDSIRKKSHAEKVKPVNAHSKKVDMIGFFFKNKLIFSISLLSIISYNVFILIDYTFITQVKLRFENIAELAQYIAVFFAVGRLIALLFKLIFTSRLIERSGIITCLFITPVALFVFCVLFMLYGNESNHNILVFGIMAMLTEILRSTIQEPVFFILFQPLKEQLRLKGHIISKGYMFPPSLIVVGVTLYLFHKSGISITIALTIKMLLANLVLWTLIIFFVKRAYLKTVHSSIKKGLFSSDEIHVYDKKVFDILLDKVKNGQKNEVLYSLKLLQKAKYSHLDPLLEKELYNGNAEIRKYALEELSAGGKIDLETLRSMLSRETHALVKEKLVSLLCQHDHSYLKAASEDLTGYKDDIRKTIIIHLLNHKEFSYLIRAGNEINNLVVSENWRDKELAINIISEIQHVKFTAVIEQLINDPDPSVKRAAVMAACKLKVANLLPRIFDLLDNPESKYLAIKALQQYGENLFSELHKWPGSLLKHADEFIRIAGKIKGNSSTVFLLSKLTDPAFDNQKIINALWTKDYVPVSASESKTLYSLLNSYLDNGVEKINNYFQVPHFNHYEIVKSAVYSEVKNDLITALKISTILFKKKDVNRIIELVQTDKINMLYNAMEMLELLLPKKISRALNNLFDFVLEPGNNSKVVEKVDAEGFFNKIIFNGSLAYSPWTKAVYMYFAWKNNETGVLNSLAKNAYPNEHILLTETRTFVLGELNN